jgi:hypothetical protein
MAATISEHPESRSFTIARQSVRELRYTILNTDDEQEVQALLESTAPPVYGGLELDGLQVEAVWADEGAETGVWVGYARYVRAEDTDEYTFDTGGGTAHITQALETIASYAPSGMTAPDTGGAIGATSDRVEGADIIVPAFNFTETHRFSNAAVLAGYKGVLFNLTGTVNDDTFRDFASGEALFLGATGSRRGFDDQWSITFRWAASPNQSGLSFGGMTGISKLGWDIFDIAYKEFEDSFSMTLVQRPVGLQVHRVYRFGDFSLLNIGP